MLDEKFEQQYKNQGEDFVGFLEPTEELWDDQIVLH